MNVIERIERGELNIGFFAPGGVIRDEKLEAELLQLVKIGQELVQMHKDCSDCSTASICANLADCYDENDDICQGCECFTICGVLVKYYAKDGEDIGY